MKKPNMTPNSRLLGQTCCSFKEFLYTKTCLILLICLLPTMMFAQNNKQEVVKAKEKLLQSQIDAKHGNKADVIQQQFKKEQLSSSELLQYKEALIEANQELAWKTKNLKLAGFSDAEIASMLPTASEMAESNVKTLNGDSSAFRTSGGSDLCADATPISCLDGPVTGDTFGASTTGVPSTTCGTSGGAGGVWYKFTGNGSSHTASLCSSSFDTKIRVYSGSCTGLVCVGGNDDSCGIQSSYTFSTTDGTQYFIYVYGYGSSQGTFTLNLTATNCSPPPNDGLSCDTAMAIGCGDSDSGTTTGSTAVGPTSFCGAFSTTAPGVWYVVDGEDNEITASLCGSSYDTKIFVYEGSCSGLVCVTGNDDTFSGLCGTTRSAVTFDADAGSSYYIWVTGYGSNAGAYTLDITCENTPPPPPNENAPANDLCADAIPLVCGDSIDGTTIDSTTNGTPAADCDGEYGTTLGQGVWYSITGTGTDMTFSTCNDADYDTKIAIFSGTCGTLTCVGGNDDGPFGCSGFTSEYTLDSVLGENYLVYISGYSSSFSGTTEEGNFTLTVTCADPNPPGNDLCADATEVFCDDVITGTTISSTAIGAPTEDCSEYNQVIGDGVWHTFMGTGDIITMSLCASGYDTKILVLDGSCGALSCVAGNDDNFAACGSGFRSEVEFTSTAGTLYYIYITGYVDFSSGEAATGNYTLEVTCQADPCLNAESIACGEVKTGTTVGGSSVGVPGGYCGTTPGATGVMYTFVPTADQFITASLCNSGYDTKINIYSGACGALTCVTGNDDNSAACGSGFRSQVDFFASTGETYYIFISGFGTATGNYVLALTCQDPEPNDTCGFAIPLDCDSSVTGNTTLSTNVDAPGADCDGEFGTTMQGQGVWYSIVGTGGDINLSTCNDADFDTKIAVFTGSCGALTCFTGNDDGPGCSGFTSEVQFSTNLGEQYYIYVTGFGSTTSVSSGEFTLNVDCICIADAGECDTVYNGYGPASSTELTASIEYSVPPYTYAWSDGQFGETITVSPIVPTTYTVTITGADGCVATDDVFVDVIDVVCGNQGDKVAMCHRSGNGYHTICVSPSAVESHMRHGDSLGPCESNEVTCGEPYSGDDGNNRIISDWTIYPNPSRGEINLDLKVFLGSDVNIQVIDLSGNVILNSEVKSLDDPRFKIELKGVTNGMYFVRVLSDKDVSTKKLLIRN